MRIASVLATAAILVLTAVSVAHAAPACGAQTAALPQVASAAKGLREAGAKHEDMDTDVSADERAALKAFKQALAEGVETRLGCLPADADATGIEKDLAVSLGAAPAGKPEADGGIAPGFGEDLKVGAGSGSGQPGLMLVQISFAIPCGDDNLLLGYRAMDGHWKRVLLWQADDYDSIAGALGSPFNVVPLATGQLALTHGTPWCTSTWSKFGLDLVRPAEGLAPQHTVFHFDHGYRLDQDFSLAARPDGFEVRAEIGMLDADTLMRQGIFRFKVDGDAVERIQPIARNGRDFVDEWLQVDEPLARAWSDAASASDTLRARSALLKSDPSVTYGAVRACKGRTGQYQVQIDAGSTYFALLRQEANGFTVIRLGEKPEPACKGADLMNH